MSSLRDDRGSQSLLALGLLALNLAALLVILGASSLLVQQRVLNNYTDALALDLADWLRVNRDDAMVYPVDWERTVSIEQNRLLRGSTLQRMGTPVMQNLEVSDDRTVSVEVCSESWLSIGNAFRVCAKSTATQG